MTKQLQKWLKSSGAFLASKKLIVLLLILVLILGILGFFFKSWFVVALVNNTPISRFAFDRDLEKQIGKQVLENKITELLILQEAKKENVDVPQADIDKKIKDIENQISAQGQNLDTILQFQGQTREGLKQQVKIQLLVEKMLGKQVQVTDKDIATYFESNKQSYPKGTTLESQKEVIREQLFQKQLGEKFPAWIADLKQKARISYFLTF